MKILTLLALLATATLSAQDYNKNDVLPHVYTVDSIISYNTLKLSLNGLTYKVLISNIENNENNLSYYLNKQVKLLKQDYGYDGNGSITALMFYKDELITF